MLSIYDVTTATGTTSGSEQDAPLPPRYRLPFVYAACYSLVASFELMLRPSFRPNLTTREAGQPDEVREAAFATDDYAVSRWIALRTLLEEGEPCKEANHVRAIIASLSGFYGGEEASSTEALLTLRKLIFGSTSPTDAADQRQQEDPSCARLFDQLRRRCAIVPFLCSDMFSLLVPSVLLQLRCESDASDHVDHLVRLLFIGTVLQSLITIAQATTTGIQQQQPLPTSTLAAYQRALAARLYSSSSSSSSSSCLPSVGSLQFTEEVQRLTLPFLYQVVLFKHLCLGCPLDPSNAHPAPHTAPPRLSLKNAHLAFFSTEGKEVLGANDEYAALLGMLALPSSLDELLGSLDQNPSSGLSRLVEDWLHEFFFASSKDAHRAHLSLLPPVVAPAVPYELDRYRSTTRGS